MEADKPGKYFDNRTHYFEVLNTARQARREGADRVALFGSRLRGEHTPNESDTDILIVKEGTSVSLAAVRPNSAAWIKASSFLSASQADHSS